MTQFGLAPVHILACSWSQFVQL